MPIDSKHPLYSANERRWQLCRDAYEGEDAIKSRADLYLPRPGGLDHMEYNAYLMRASFYEAVGRTIDGFIGAISRKEPTLDIPAALQPIVGDATADGLSLNELTKRLCAEAILQARGGVLVDFDDKTQRAYLCCYPAEAITNWSNDGVVLREIVYEVDTEDAFQQKAIEQYRQLTLVDGVYTVAIWRKVESEWAQHLTIKPTRRGKYMDSIPFFWVTPMGKTSRIEKPPLLGLVNVCLSHYRNSADLEHGLHFTGLPTLYVTGSTPTDEPIRVGSLSAITVQDPHSKVGYAEFSGAGLGAIQATMSAKQAQMAVLGASVFHDGPKGVEAAETARIRTSGETSLLSGVVTAVEETLKAALECAAAWMSVPGVVSITLNRDFVDTTIDGPMLTALVAAYQSGALSLPQFLYSLQQSDLLAPGTDLVEEAKIVDAAIAVRRAALTKSAQNTPPVNPVG